jgi:lysophospholipase L1-like esterase
MPGVGVGTGVWRRRTFGAGGVIATAMLGVNQGSRIATQGFNNGAGIRSRLTRAKKYSKVGFRYYQIVIPVFYPTGSPINDTLYAGAQAVLRFQHGIEYPYTNAVTGLAARKATTWAGLNYVAYDNATYDGITGYLISDVMDFGSVIPADAAYGEWLTVELPAGGTNVLPWTGNGSSFIQRYEGGLESAASLITAYGGASDAALSNTSITGYTTAQTGAAQYFMPTITLIEAPASTKTVAVIGDSISYGVGEGAAGSASAGDTRGSALGNTGYVDRWLYESAGLNAVNLGRGSDRLQYLKTPSNWRYRRNLLAISKPKIVIMQNAVNDISSTISNLSWTAATAYARFDVVVVGGGAAYLVTVAGTSGGVPPVAPGAIGDTVADGTCTLRYLGASASGNPWRRAMDILGRIAFAVDQVKQVLPSVKIVQTIPTPSVTTTDSYATVVNQTPAVGWGDATTSIRGNMVTLLNDAAIRGILGIDAVIDPNPGVENAPQTSRWVVNGTAFYAVPDGVHPNSTGAALAAAAIPAGMLTSL